MFTGIIEASGTVGAVEERGSNRSFWIKSDLAPQLQVDQSVAHNGVCLTVEAIGDNDYKVTAVAETLGKTELGFWRTGTQVNLERSLQLNSRLDGHFVQGHVDATGTCEGVVDKNGSYEVTFSFPHAFAALVIEKGSVCVNGVSLTAFAVTTDRFTVALIPYTWNHTNLHTLTKGTAVNLEFDMIGKYIVRSKLLQHTASQHTLEF